MSPTVRASRLDAPRLDIARGRVSKARSAASGGVSLLAGQVIVTLVQIAYSGFTGRALVPEAFGHFSIAISATGLAALLITTGLASYVVTQRDLPNEEVHLVQALSWIAGIAAAGLVAVCAPLWVLLWSGDQGAVPMTRLLALQVLIASPAAVQSALLRREGRPVADAMVQTTSILVGFAVATPVILCESRSAGVGAVADCGRRQHPRPVFDHKVRAALVDPTARSASRLRLRQAHLLAEHRLLRSDGGTQLGGKCGCLRRRAGTVLPGGNADTVAGHGSGRRHHPRGAAVLPVCPRRRNQSQSRDRLSIAGSLGALPGVWRTVGTVGARR